MTSLSIVIATFNRIHYLLKLLNQIKYQKDHSLNVSIIVIDDGSEDGTGEMILQLHPDVILIKGNGSWWWTKCMNEGFKKALEINSDFVLILNDDNEIQPDYLNLLADSYSKIPENTILGSISVSIENPELIEMSGTKSFNRFWLKSKQYLKLYTPDIDDTKILPTYSLCGRGTLIPCKIFSKIGFFDEKLVQYGSDEEFIWRAKKFNINSYISWKVKVLNHTYMTSTSSSLKRISLGEFNKSFFNVYSINSLSKNIYLYVRYGYPVFLPIFLIYTILGSYKAYFVNYRKLKQ